MVRKGLKVFRKSDRSWIRDVSGKRGWNDKGVPAFIYVRYVSGDRVKRKLSDVVGIFVIVECEIRRTGSAVSPVLKSRITVDAI